MGQLLHSFNCNYNYIGFKNSILATRDTQFGQELALVMQTTHAQRWQYPDVSTRVCFLPLKMYTGTVEPRYNEVLGTMKFTLLYPVSHYIRVKKQRNIKSWDQQNDLVIRGFCYIRPLYNEVLLYYKNPWVWV